ncbi:Imm10 family immunity protein [Pseudoduganella sp. R-31]|uniref:Imm10 family immunity protein n=1 Tax=unclassified Pseudoduganella TaxID=2637179 RepID=UPI003CF23F18
MMAAEENAIRAVHAKWVEAANAADLSSLLAIMTEDVVFLNPGEAPIGREGFSAKFTAAHQEFRIACGSELKELVVADDFAYTRSADHLSVTPRAGGNATLLAGQRMTIYRKLPDGQWHLSRDAHTLSPVQSFNFFASEVSAAPVDGIWTVAFGGPAHGDYFLVQRDVENVLGERGLNVHYIELGGQSKGCYGGVEKVQVLPDAVKFQFTSDAAVRIGLSGIVVSFSLSKAELALVSSALAHIVEHGRVEVL